MLTLITRIVKSVITVCVLSLLLTACRHVEPEPERRATEAEIRQHIVGEWTATDKSDGYWFPKLIVAEDGRLFGVESNGTRELIGTWEMSHTLLRVTPSPARFEAARVSGVHLNGWDYYPVIYADAHELVMTPGISVAGRWRYDR
jgi:hypothetical protein